MFSIQCIWLYTITDRFSMFSAFDYTQKNTQAEMIVHPNPPPPPPFLASSIWVTILEFTAISWAVQLLTQDSHKLHNAYHCKGHAADAKQPKTALEFMECQREQQEGEILNWLRSNDVHLA